MARLEYRNTSLAVFMCIQRKQYRHANKDKAASGVLVKKTCSGQCFAQCKLELFVELQRAGGQRRRAPLHS